MAKQTIIDVQTAEQLTSIIESGVRLIANFHAPWAAPCAQMNAVFTELHKTLPEDTLLRFASVPAEALPDITASYKVATVPTLLFFYCGRIVSRFSGADVTRLTKSTKWLAEANDDELTRAACEQVTKLGEVTLIMKGSPDTPKCGFSRQVVEILRKQGVVFESFDVLEDEEIRQAIKTYADWPTFPMLWSAGRLIGGVDIIRELAENGQLVEELGKTDNKIENKTEKKDKQAPEVETATEGKTEKPVSAPDKPDGSEAAKKREEDGEVLQKRLEALTKQEPVMLFMKGSPDAPRCGFSRKMVDLLRTQKVTFGHFDILEDPVVRAGLKTYSDWPTYPQLYSGGRFIGGLDVVMELVEGGMFEEEVRGTA